MGINVDITDICDFIDLDDNDDNDGESSINTNTLQHQPIINIINSTVNYHSNNVVYDDNNDYDFVFEDEPEGTFGVPSAGPNDDDIDGLDFGDIIEI
jgi:hypothetical protein